jgi:voltage-gated potassium channel|tara:strand:+ start:170 stop:1270 length:1101 start_codon:yes stop_codon:yes gene_type:complete
MKSDLSKKIAAAEKFSFENLSIGQLKTVRDEIISRKSEIITDLDKINSSIEELTNSDDESTKLFIPKRFSTPLRQIFIMNRELEEIKITNERYDTELVQLKKIIQRKILSKKLEDTLGSKWMVYAKEIVITILIILVLSAMYYEYTQTGISPELVLKLFLFDTACCMVFLINFFFELWLADSKKWYWKTHWIDFVTSIPIPDAKILRTGRLLRLARLLRIFRFLRFFRVTLLLFRGFESFAELFDMKLMKKTLFVTFVFMLMGSGAILYFEQRPENINTFIEGIWWSFTTIVVGGYGDIHNPVTIGGMLVTMMLVIAGMVLIGVFIATLSTILSSKETDEIGFLKKYMDDRLSEMEATITEKLNDK